MEIELRPVAGHEGYFVSNDGKVFSCRRPGMGYRTPGPLRERSQSPAERGYMKVSLWNNGHEHTKTVHRLVAEAFHGEAPPGMEVRHLDGNKKNNHASNLAWGTRRENDDDKIRHGASTPGTKNAQAKLTEETVYRIKARLASGERATELAAEFGVTDGAVGNIARGIGWRHVQNPDGFVPSIRSGVGSENAMAKLSEADVLRIREMLSNGATQTAVAKAMAVSRSLIGMIKNRQIWAHVP